MLQPPDSMAGGRMMPTTMPAMVPPALTRARALPTHFALNQVRISFGVVAMPMAATNRAAPEYRTTMEVTLFPKVPHKKSMMAAPKEPMIMVRRMPMWSTAYPHTRPMPDTRTP